jgi:hypothetical protein
MERIRTRNIIFLYEKLGENHVRKVRSRFECFLLIFALRLGMILKVVGMDAELNSLSNGDIFEGGHRAKNRVRVRGSHSAPSPSHPHPHLG